MIRQLDFDLFLKLMLFTTAEFKLKFDCSFLSIRPQFNQQHKIYFIVLNMNNCQMTVPSAYYPFVFEDCSVVLNSNVKN